VDTVDVFAGLDPAVARRTFPIYQRMQGAVPHFKWPTFAPDIDAILRLKRERNAVVLAHNYQTPEIFHGVADIVGDSLALAREAAKSDADIIVVCGVHFMAETAKLLNPRKKVLTPDPQAGCSLAESITGADVRALKAKHPGVPVVAYVNTSAEVKAEVDVCCTSANAKKVVEWAAKEFNSRKVIFLPDEYLAANVAAETDVEIISWPGRCEVHERFTPDDVAQLREAHPGVVVLAHPECSPEVIAASDYTGSTAGMIDYVAKESPKSVMMVTECSMADNVAVQYPKVEFVKPCRFCPHMNRITLPKIRRALETAGEASENEVLIPEVIAARARLPIDRMLEIG
jgi:quinolinate synthase